MIVLGLVLIILGVLLPIPYVETIGIVLFIIGLALWLSGTVGYPVAGRRFWY